MFVFLICLFLHNTKAQYRPTEFVSSAITVDPVINHAETRKAHTAVHSCRPVSENASNTQENKVVAFSFLFVVAL